MTGAVVMAPALSGRPRSLLVERVGTSGEGGVEPLSLLGIERCEHLFLHGGHSGGGTDEPMK